MSVDDVDDMTTNVAELAAAVRTLKRMVLGFRFWLIALAVTLLLSLAAGAGAIASTRYGISQRDAARCATIATVDERVRSRVIRAMDAWSTEVVDVLARDPAEAAAAREAVRAGSVEMDRVLSEPTRIPGCDDDDS